MNKNLKNSIREQFDKLLDTFDKGEIVAIMYGYFLALKNLDFISNSEFINMSCALSDWGVKDDDA